MSEHTLNYSFTVDAPRQTVFEFVTDAANAGRLVPPELEFEILSPLPVEMKVGATIVYRIKLFGMHLTWKGRISAWFPPNSFSDEQLEGPYRHWVHRHTFRDGPDGSTVVEDEVRFRLPRLGEAVFPLVRNELERIFRHRQEAIAAEFPEKASDHSCPGPSLLRT